MPHYELNAIGEKCIEKFKKNVTEFLIIFKTTTLRNKIIILMEIN
jgi:hypothetical protein